MSFLREPIPFAGELALYLTGLGKRNTHRTTWEMAPARSGQPGKP